MIKKIIGLVLICLTTILYSEVVDKVIVKVNNENILKSEDGVVISGSSMKEGKIVGLLRIMPNI
jgi:spore germination protein GerM